MSAMYYREIDKDEKFDFNEVINGLNEVEKNILKILYKPMDYNNYDNHKFCTMGITTIQTVLIKLFPQIDENELMKTIISLDDKGLTDDLKSIMKCQMNDKGIELLENRLSNYGKRFCESYF